ncbi:MAG: hypothetical protein JJU11_02570 [Candidatus Sumerlaeia bacterium]|nr:hypothetical protein [Candidatus Sumerlaeia bacterium]
MIFRSLILFATVFAVASCTMVQTSETAPEPTPAPEPPPPVVVQVETDPLIAQDLVGKVAIRNYQWDEENHPSISFVLENLTATESFELELSSEFYDHAGEPRFRTPWTRFVVEPGKRHHYYAQADRRGVIQGRVFLRQVIEGVDTTE